jgi:mannose-6-phosphate isomerase-like protein (cupin superfamily)
MEKVNEHSLEYRHKSHGPKYFFRGDRYEWGVICLRPGDKLGGHYHKEVEETFYFPDSAPIMVVDDVENRVSPGDVFKLAPGEKHDIQNDTPNLIRIIFIKCPYLPDDKIAEA